MFDITTSGEIKGITILKLYGNKKICTIRVGDKFQKQGLGTKMMIKSMEILECNKPLITVSNSRNNEFLKLFKYLGFKKRGEVIGLYVKNVSEIIYN